jgi:hypothetical protein
MSRHNFSRALAAASLLEDRPSAALEHLKQIPISEHSEDDQAMFVAACLTQRLPFEAIQYLDSCSLTSKPKQIRNVQPHNAVGNRIKRGLLFEIANEMALNAGQRLDLENSLAKSIAEIQRFNQVNFPTPCVDNVLVPNEILRHGITQIWVGSPVNSTILKMNALWSQHFDSKKCRFIFGEEPFDFCRDYLGPRANDLIRNLKINAAKTDLLRLIYLHAFGGLWSDIDDYPLVDPKLWFPNADLVLYKTDLGNLGNNFIGATPAHPAILNGIELGLQAASGGFSESIWLSTGPGLLTRAFGSYLAKQRESEGAQTSHVFDRHVIKRFVSFHVPLDYKSTSSSWQRAERFEKFVPTR